MEFNGAKENKIIIIIIMAKRTTYDCFSLIIRIFEQ